MFLERTHRAWASASIRRIDLVSALAAIGAANSQKRSGVNHLPSLLGRATPERPFICIEHSEAASMLSACLGRFTATRPNRSHEPSRLELYDMTADPADTKDLAGLQPNLVAQARQIAERERHWSPDFPLPCDDMPAKPSRLLV